MSDKMMNTNVRSISRFVGARWLLAATLIVSSLAVSAGCGPDVAEESNTVQEEHVERHFPAFEGDYIVGSNPKIKLTSQPVADEEKLDLILAPDVYPLEEDVASHLDTETDDEFIEFDVKAVPPLVSRRAVGDIVISKDSRINWRRIISIERDGDTVRWKTERPKMTEVFEQGDFYFRADITNGAPSVDLIDPYLNPEGPIQQIEQASTPCETKYVEPYRCGSKCKGLGYSWDAAMGTCVKNKGDDDEQTKNPTYHCEDYGHKEDRTRQIEISESSSSRLNLTTFWNNGTCRCYLADSAGGNPLFCDPDTLGSCDGNQARNGDDVPMGCQVSSDVPSGQGGGYCYYCEGDNETKTSATADKVSGFLAKLLGKLATRLLSQIPVYPKTYFKIQPDLVFNVKIGGFKVKRLDLLIRADFLLGIGTKFEFKEDYEYSVGIRYPSEEEMGRPSGQAMGNVMTADSKIAEFYIYGYPFAIAYELHGGFSLKSATNLTLVADYKYYTTREHGSDAGQLAGKPMSWAEAGADWERYRGSNPFNIDVPKLVDALFDGLTTGEQGALGNTAKILIDDMLSAMVGEYDPNGEAWFNAEIEGDWDPVMGVYTDDEETGLAQGFSRGPDANCEVDGTNYGPPCTPAESEACEADPSIEGCPCNCIKKENEDSYRIKKFEATSLFNIYVDGEASVDVQAEAGVQLGIYDGVSSSRLIFLEPVNLFLSAFAALRPPYCGFGLSLFYRVFLGFGPIELFGLTIIEDEFKLPVLGFPILKKDWTLPAEGRNCYNLDNDTEDGVPIENPNQTDLAMTVMHVGGNDADANYRDPTICPGCAKDINNIGGYRSLNWIDNTSQCRIVRALASIGLACGASQSDYNPAPAELCNTDADCEAPDVDHPRCVDRFCVDQPSEGLRITLGWVPDTELDLTVVGPAAADVGLCQRVDSTGFRHVKNATIPAPPTGSYEIRVSDLGGTWDDAGSEWAGECGNGGNQLEEIPFTLQIEYRGRETKQLEGTVDRCADNFPVTFHYVVGADDGAGQNSLVEVSAPSSIVPGALESDAEILLFAETGSTALVLDDPVEVDVVSPTIRGAGDHSDNIPVGTYDLGAAHESYCGVEADGTSDDAGTIPGGQTAAVFSYYVHFDPIGDTGLVNLSGSYTFDDRIIGIVGRKDSLSNSHAALGTSTAYPNELSEPTNFGVERDPITIDSDGRTLHFDLREIDSSDSIRVITECVDDRSDELKCAQHFPNLSCGPVGRTITNDCGLQEDITCATTLTCPVSGDDVSETTCEDDGVSGTNSCVCSESYCGGLSGNWACNSANDECVCTPTTPTQWCRDNDQGCGSYTISDGCGTTGTIDCYVYNDNWTHSTGCKTTSCTPSNLSRDCSSTSFSTGNRCCCTGSLCGDGTASCWGNNNGTDLTIFGKWSGDAHDWGGFSCD
jgi:hypothetical protein